MDDPNAPKPLLDEELTPTPENTANILLTPNGPVLIDEPTLRQLVDTGAIRQVSPAVRRSTEMMDFDFIKHFYPKDPEGAKRYFAAEQESKNNDL